MRFFHKINASFMLTVLTALILVSAVGCSEPEQSAVPVAVPVFADIPLPKLEITKHIIKEAMPETTEETTPEAEVIEEAAQDPDVGELLEFTEEFVFTAYDIPLSAELQRYIFDLCEERGLDFEIVLALIYAESSFRPYVISRTNDYGLMQLNRVNHKWLTAELGITDFLDAEQNINAGTFMLMNISERYPDVHKMLMVYNFGEAGARRFWNRGIYDSRYSRKITAKADELKSQNAPE